MKKILGLDIGTSSIGWAFVLEDEENAELNKIQSAGVRIIPMGDEEKQFIEGKTVTLNVERRTYRTIRRNNQRYKLRRHNLVKKLIELNMIPDENLLKRITAFELYGLRDKVLKEKISLEELGRVFFHLNQKRGYKSNRKANKETETDFTQIIINRSKIIEDEGITVGQFFYQKLLKNKETPDANFIIKKNTFLRQDYLNEFNAIWNFQRNFYPELLNDQNLIEIRDRIIYYQRRLKSQKGLVGECRFEKFHKVVPKSSPIFQLFNIYSKLNNLAIASKDGEIIEITPEGREKILLSLNYVDHISKTKLLEMLDCKPTRHYYINFENLEGNKTRAQFLNVLTQSGCDTEKIKHLLAFDPMYARPDLEPFYKLWHLVYSSEEDHQLIKNLMEDYSFTDIQAEAISKIGYTSQHGSLSAKAIRKLLPYLKQGLKYSEACEKVGYNHSDSETIEQRNERVLVDRLEQIKRNDLRNPVVEKISNQVITLVNSIISDPQFGRPDEIRVELARELKQNAKEREDLTKTIRENETENKRIEKILLEEWGFKKVSRKDIIKFRLWQETGGVSVYTGNTIQKSELYDTAKIDVEHIIPRALLFDDSFSNKTLCETSLNREKSNETALDFISSRGIDVNENYRIFVKKLFEEKAITRTKFNKLMMKKEDLPEDFIARQLRESQYIAREITKRLKSVCRNVVSTTGSVTDYLRFEWGLDTILHELNLEKYRKMGKTFQDTDHSGNKVERITEWTKRNDHRHHAVDAIVIAFTKQGMIQKLNTLHSIKGGLQNEMKDYIVQHESWRIKEPCTSIRPQAKRAVERILISFKTNRKVLTKHINKIKIQGGELKQVTYTPRGFLHKETMYGQIRRYEKIKLDKKFTSELYVLMANPFERFLVEKHLGKYDNKFEQAFSTKTLKSDPLYVDEENKKVLETISVFNHKFVYRVALNRSFDKVNDIVDQGVKKIIQKRLEEFGNDHKKAFNDLEKNPVWFNDAKRIPIKTIRVFGPVTLQPLHVDENGKPKDFVQTRNNHHIAIYEDEKGNRYEKVVTFWEAIERKQQGISIIDKNPHAEHKFITSMQVNDLFVFNLDPSEIDFYKEDNWPLVSTNLYRVQNLSNSDYSFRHHLETTLKNTATKIRIQDIKKMNGVKVILDHFGRVIQLGEK